ncbi:hypothetical protein K2Z83_10225 [Oscillochloris sp. ZM17-4]|uniref:hypothetical protein n=1 Tax=Oscillochloris sp. ZM17-4 TaxID=2866714 RepID=UPI001C72FEE5|nr:hypothetical protein [Oscillochloris sp. ZM17-4]MBX0328052.1 hypothetical protein [Oscillochloris sp. ZM17-4]
MTRRPAARRALLILITLSVALSARPAAARPPAAVSVRVDPARTLTLNGSFMGLGAEDDSNLLWSGPNRAAGARPAADIDAYVSPRLRALAMPLARKFIDVSWFAPTPEGYTWDSPAMRALYANLAVHRAANTKIMLTIWSLPPWLSAGPADARDSELRPALPFPDPAHEARWADLTADLLRHLRGLDGSGLRFSNVAYVGGPNELAGTDAAGLVRPLGLLRERLAASGLGDVAIFGPDSFVEELLIARDTPGLDPLLDLYDFHYYAAAPLEAGFVAAADRLAAAVAPTGKQIWLTEFGELTAKNDDWRSLPIFAIGGMNHGLAALAVWNVQDQIYNTTNMPEWGLWGVYDSGYALKPAYYAWQMMAAHLPDKASVYGHSCDREQCPGLRLAVLGGLGGALAVVAYNLADTPQQLSLDLGGLTVRRSLGRYTLDPAAPSPAGLSIPRQDAPALVDGVLRDSLPPGALVVYATDPAVYCASQSASTPCGAVGR